MSIQHTLVRQYRDSSSVTIQATDVVAADGENNFDGVITASATNVEVDWAAVRANLKCLMITSDHAVVIKTNDATTPTSGTVTLAAAQIALWSLVNDAIGKCPFTGDVTKLYVTNNDASDAHVKIRALQDVTP